MRTGFSSLTLHTLGKALKDDILIFGGDAAYTSLLAFFPLVIFLLALAGTFGNAAIANTLIQHLLELMPREIVEVLAPVIRAVMEEESPELLTLGGLGTLWVASSGVEELRFGLNKVHAVGEFRPFWKRRLQSLGVVLAGGLAFLLLLAAIIIWPLLTWLISEFLFIPLEDILALDIMRFLLATALLFALICTLYHMLPNQSLRWREVWPGALLATLLWLMLAQLFSVYLAHSGSYDATYGSIAGVIITLIFFHYSAVLVLLGAELNSVLKKE